MKRSIKTILIVVIGILAIAYIGFRMNLFPTSVIEDSKEQLQETAEQIEDTVEQESGRSSKSWLRQIFDGLDSGMQSNASKDEEENADYSDFEKSLECFYVESVVDGDTIWVSNDNHPDGIKVRYIGIDTPESVHDDASKNTAEGKVAAQRNEEIIQSAGNDIYLEYDEGKTDDYGRTLAYVYIYDWETEEYQMIEDILLEEGMCQTMTIEPNTKYSEHFKELESKARAEKVGFWGTGFYK